MRGAGELSQLRGRQTHQGRIRERGRCVEHGGVAGNGGEGNAAASQINRQTAQAIANDAARGATEITQNRGEVRWRQAGSVGALDVLAVARAGKEATAMNPARMEM